MAKTEREEQELILAQALDMDEPDTAELALLRLSQLGSVGIVGVERED